MWGSVWYIPMGSYIPIIGHLLHSSDIPTVNTKIFPIKHNLVAKVIINILLQNFVRFRFSSTTFFCLICYEDWMRKQSITAELKQCGSDGVGRSNSLFEENHTIKKMSWHSWVIVWLKEFHCLKVKTLLRFYWDSKYHFVSIIDSNIKITAKIQQRFFRTKQWIAR